MGLLFNVALRATVLLSRVLALVLTPLLKVPVVGRLVDVATTGLGSVLRLFNSAFVLTPANARKDRTIQAAPDAPKNPQAVEFANKQLANLSAKDYQLQGQERLALVLFEFEACPFCKKVREVATQLDLDLLVLPAPRETFSTYGAHKNSRYRPVLNKIGGKSQFPFLIDANTGVALYESDAIANYLLKTYSHDPVHSRPFTMRYLPAGLDMALLFAASMVRPLDFHGKLRFPSKAPAKPLELWSYEVSPYCRLVREALDSLELPYVLHNIARGSSKRPAFEQMAGKLQFPYLRDPNTGFASFESRTLVDYIKRTYWTGEQPDTSF